MTAIDTPDWLPNALPGAALLATLNFGVNAGVTSPAHTVPVAGYQALLITYEISAISACNFDFTFNNGAPIPAATGPTTVASVATTTLHFLVLTVSGPDLAIQVANTGATNVTVTVLITGMQTGGTPNPVIPPTVLGSANLAVAGGGANTSACNPCIAGDGVLIGNSQTGAWIAQVQANIGGTFETVAQISGATKTAATTALKLPPGDLQLRVVDTSGAANTIGVALTSG